MSSFTDEQLENYIKAAELWKDKGVRMDVYPETVIAWCEEILEGRRMHDAAPDDQVH